MKFIKYIGLFSLFFSLCHTGILVFGFIEKDIFTEIQYHHSNNWTWYLIYFIGPTIIALLAGLLIYQKTSSLKNNGKLLTIWGIINLSVVLTANIVIVVLSKSYWGFVFKRPAIFSEVASAYKIINASTVFTINKDDQKQFIIDTVGIDDILYGRRDPYYGNRDRVFMTFQDNAPKHGLLYNWHEILIDESKKINTNTLEGIASIIYSLNFIEPGVSKWDTTKNIRGEIIEFVTEDSVKYYHAGLNGGQVANDHYPFYEILLVAKDNKIELIKKQKYFYDVAGIEGLEYSTIEPLITTFAFIILSILFGVTSLTRMVVCRIKR